MRVGQRASGGGGLGCGAWVVFRRASEAALWPPSYMQIRLVKPPARRALFSLRALLYGPPSHSAAPGSLLHCRFLYYWVFLALLYRCIIRGMVLFFLLCVSCAALRLDRMQGVWRVEGGLGDASNLVCFFLLLSANVAVLLVVGNSWRFCVLVLAKSQES